jgi:ABC-type Zn2+ transport system substrate-binding protein/surface adhesin
MRFSIRFLLEFFAATHVKRERGEKQDRQADVNGIQHNLPKGRYRHGASHDHITDVYVWVNLKVADFAAQRIALPNADEVS